MNITSEIIYAIENSKDLVEFEEYFENFRLEKDISEYLVSNYIPKENYKSEELSKFGEGDVFQFLWSTAIFHLLSKTKIENFTYLFTKILSEDNSWNKTNAFKAICRRYKKTKDITLRNLIVNSLFTESQFLFMANLTILFNSNLTVEELDELVKMKFDNNIKKQTITSLVANFVLIREFAKKTENLNKEYQMFIRDMIADKIPEMETYKKINLLEYKMLKGNALLFYSNQWKLDIELLRLYDVWRENENHKSIKEILKKVKADNNVHDEHVG
jgi:hypothetical protein